MNGWLRYNVRCSADVAQSVEHLIGNEEVGSSNLLISSKTDKAAPRKGCCFSVFRQISLFGFLPYEKPILVMCAEPSAACGGYSEVEAQ